MYGFEVDGRLIIDVNGHWVFEPSKQEVLRMQCPYCSAVLKELNLVSDTEPPQPKNLDEQGVKDSKLVAVIYDEKNGERIAHCGFDKILEPGETVTLEFNVDGTFRLV